MFWVFIIADHLPFAILSWGSTVTHPIFIFSHLFLSFFSFLISSARLYIYILSFIMLKLKFYVNITITTNSELLWLWYMTIFINIIIWLLEFSHHCHYHYLYQLWFYLFNSLIIYSQYNARNGTQHPHFIEINFCKHLFSWD